MNLLLFFCGIFLGIISGLIPGVHINLVGAIFPLKNIWFLIPLSISYSFFNTFPLFLLQFPDESNYLTLNLIQRLIVSGRAKEGLKITIFGSLIGSIFGLLFGILVYFIDLSFLKNITLIILSAIFLFLLRYDLVLGTLYAIFGVLILDMNLNQPLFHFFSLGFALYNFLHLSNNLKKEIKRKNNKRIKRENNKNNKKNLKKVNKNINKNNIKINNKTKAITMLFVSSFVSFIFLFYPGISASLSLLIMMFLTNKFTKSKDEIIQLYLYYIGISNSTAYVVANFLTRYGIGRNYIALIIRDSNITFSFFELILISLLSIIVSFLSSLVLLNIISNIIQRLNLRMINFIVLIFTFILSFMFDSIFGIIVGVGSYALLRLIILRSKPRFLMMLAIISKVLFFKLFK